MTVNEILVGQVQRGHAHLAMNHIGNPLEEPLVMRRKRRAISHDEGRLAASSGASGALGVIGRSRRNVAHVDHVQGRDINAKLHRRRAVHHRQRLEALLRIFFGEVLLVLVLVAEAHLEHFAQFGLDLRRVLMRLVEIDALAVIAKGLGRPLIKIDEEAVADRSVSTNLVRVLEFGLIGQRPDNRRGIKAALDDRMFCRTDVRRLHNTGVTGRHQENLHGVEQKRTIFRRIGEARPCRICGPLSLPPETLARSSVPFDENLEKARRERSADRIMLGQLTIGETRRLVLLKVFLALLEEIEILRTIKVVLVGRHAPGFEQVAIAALPNLILLLRIEIVAADAERLAKMIEHELRKLMPFLHRERAQYLIGQQLLRIDQLMHPTVLDLQQAQLLEIRIVKTPFAAKIGMKAITQHKAEHLLRRPKSTADQFRVLKVLRKNLLVRRLEPKSLKDTVRNLTRLDPLFRRMLQGGKKSRAKRHREDELIEVSGLKRRILTIVGKAEKLVRSAFLGIHQVQRGERQNGRRGRSALS